MGLPILCLDFDGVIHSYSSGWKGADQIPDPPVPGAVAFLGEAVEHFTVAVFSSRSNQPGGLEAMQNWLHRYLPPGICGLIQWPKEKPPALVTLDDRAITFTGKWPGMRELREFKPWNKL